MCMCVCYWPPFLGVYPNYEVLGFQSQKVTPSEPMICRLLLRIYSWPALTSLHVVWFPPGGVGVLLLPRYPLHRRPLCLCTGSSAHTSIWSVDTCSFQVTQQLPCCRYLYVLRRWDLRWPGKVPGARQLVILAWFLVLELGLRLKVINFRMELKVLVNYLFCNLIAWSPWTVNGSIKIKRSPRCLDSLIARPAFIDCQQPDHVVTVNLER